MFCLFLPLLLTEKITHRIVLVVRSRLVWYQCDQQASRDAVFSKNSNSERSQASQVSAQDPFLSLNKRFSKASNIIYLFNKRAS